MGPFCKPRVFTRGYDFHGRGRKGKRQLQRSFPAETVALRGLNPLVKKGILKSPQAFQNP